MRFPKLGRRDKDVTRLEYNDYVTLTGIPAEAQGYSISGRSPLEWIIALPREDGQGVGHRQRPERLPARAGPPRRGRGPDQAPGDGIHANPGTPGDAAEAGDP